ncbi:MAG: hypothetical protein KW804_01415 [Candidatus Doudnabacteria bacterium]|nr:hypothetical protein [Candidatus Doudnabacteria bacterium]
MSLLSNIIVIALLIGMPGTDQKSSKKPAPKVVSYLFSPGQVQVRWETPSLDEDQRKLIRAELNAPPINGGIDVQPNSLEVRFDRDPLDALQIIEFALVPYLGSVELRPYGGNKAKTRK